MDFDEWSLRRQFEWYRGCNVCSLVSKKEYSLGRIFLSLMEDDMEASITGLDYKIREMAGRIKDLREIEGLTTYEMASKTQVTREEYIKCESGETDLNFTFIYRCALALGVDVTDIIEGNSPKLKSITVTRRG